MKIFVSVFSAIILAGIVLYTGHAMIERYSAWQNEKTSLLRSLRETEQELDGYGSFTTADKSSDELHAAVTRLKRLQNARLQQYIALGDLLLRKPYLGLFDDEEALEKQVLAELSLADAPRPVPTPEEPSFANNIPRQIVVTLDVVVYNPDKRVEATIPAKTRVKVLAKSGGDYLVEYNGVPFSVSQGITRESN